MCAGLKDNLHSLGEEYLVQLKEYGSYCYRKVDPSRLRSGKFTVGRVYRAWLVIRLGVMLFNWKVWLFLFSYYH